jgi:hypothetical protein
MDMTNELVENRQGFGKFILGGFRRAANGCGRKTA